MKITLHDHLAATYSQTSTGRSVASPPMTIRVDDQHSGDEPSLFCGLTVTDIAGDAFKLEICRLPLDSEVADVIAEKEAKLNRTVTGNYVELSLTVRDVSFLRQLAKAIRRLVGKGQRYSDANWKWLCPRTAASLERLADSLLEFRKLRRKGPIRQS